MKAKSTPENAKKRLLGLLTYDNIKASVDSKTFSRGQDYVTRVYDLAWSPKGELIAWVTGTQKYATKVYLHKDELYSVCNCPVGSDCKHGVAIALVTRDKIKTGAPIQEMEPTDYRIGLLKLGSLPWTETDEDNWEDDYEEWSLSDELSSLSNSDLIEIIETCAKRHPKLARDIVYEANVLSLKKRSAQRGFKLSISKISRRKKK